MNSPLVQPPVPTTLLIKFTHWTFTNQEISEGLTAAPIHKSRLCGVFAQGLGGVPDGDGRSDKADWKSVVVTWSGRRLYPLHQRRSSLADHKRLFGGCDFNSLNNSSSGTVAKLVHWSLIA